MSLRLSRFGSVALLPLLAASLLVCDAPGADSQKGRPIEFSDPKSSDIATNLSQISAKRSSLRELEDDLTKSFQSRISSGGSLDGVYVPPPGAPTGAAVPSKKFKERLDRKKNWFLGSPEDFLSGPSMADLLGVREYGPDGKEKKPLSAVEAYYERQERELNGGVDPHDRAGDHELNRSGKRDRDELAGGKKRPGLPEELDADDEAGQQKEKNQTERDLRSLFDPRPLDTSFSPESARSTPTDIFGLGIKPLSSEQAEAAENSMKQYSQFLSSFTTPASVAGTPGSLSGIADVRTVPTINSFESSPAFGRSGAFDSSPGTFSPTFDSPDTGVKGLGSLDSASVLPKAEPFKMAPPSATFEVPHRKF